ncbi:M48 family metallopeptidase [Leptospira ilyithenensis]|uniref:M48 family metallopeptidase n=1 Tax=Leptospira ilyithenensis TaxID=2484901 RepID=A0A4R9LRY2_9LEPT|nr:M48 family metallopeptidase [Leptospira ilyithenensis]TGN11162.1 M48 family metallopeptidase [Leptospira ilyithenensis]
MNQKLEFKARYFNGKSAIPESGVASLQNNRINFQSETLTQKFSIEGLANFETTPNGCKFTILPDETAESPIIEIFCTKEEKQNIESIWFENKKKQGFFQNLIYSSKQLDLRTVFLFGIFFAVVIGSFYYFILLKLYVLFPTQFDEKLGNEVNKQVESQFSICHSEEAQKFLEDAVKNLKPKDSPFNYQIKIINRPESNAFALSGGRVYFFSGLIRNASTPEEVVGVLAHELAHVEKRHHIRNLIKAMGTAFAISVVVGPGLGDFEIIETVSEIGTTIAVLKFSRDFEVEADSYSIQLLKNANYSPAGLYLFFQRLEKEESLAEHTEKTKKPDKTSDSISKKIFDFSNFLSTHPRTEDRMKAFKDIVAKTDSRKTKKLVSKDKWKRIQKACIND